MECAGEVDKRTYGVVAIEIDFVSFVNEHVDETGLSMMQVTDDGDVSDHLGVSSDSHHEPGEINDQHFSLQRMAMTRSSSNLRWGPPEAPTRNLRMRMGSMMGWERG